MTKTTLRRLLPLVWAAGLLLLARPGLGQTQSRRQDEASTPPIELSDITIEFFIQNDAGQFVWQAPESGEPNSIPAGAHRLRFTARVNNRPSGSSIRLQAAFQELCPSPDRGKRYLSRLRHLTESDPTGGQTTDKADDELRVIQSDGRVSIEIPVHCDDCVRDSCSKECSDRDHLGEGPHVATLTASDVPPDPAQRARGGRADLNAAKPVSYRLDVMSVCPKAKVKRAGS